MKTTTSSTIVFITGAFVSATCWDQWKIFFETRGLSNDRALLAL